MSKRPNPRQRGTIDTDFESTEPKRSRTGGEAGEASTSNTEESSVQATGEVASASAQAVEEVVQASVQAVEEVSEASAQAVEVPQAVDDVSDSGHSVPFFAVNQEGQVIGHEMNNSDNEIIEIVDDDPVLVTHPVLNRLRASGRPRKDSPRPEPSYSAPEIASLERISGPIVLHDDVLNGTPVLPTDSSSQCTTSNTSNSQIPDVVVIGSMEEVDVDHSNGGSSVTTHESSSSADPDTEDKADGKADDKAD